MNYSIRPAVPADIPVLRELIAASVRQLQVRDYSPGQLEAALRTVYGVDTQLISDGTYYVAEAATPSGSTIVGCGGWSKRKTLFGGDSWHARSDDLLDPRRDAAKIRAFFVHPDWARRGIGTLILETCERAAQAAAFTTFEMGATLTGVPMYKARGYVELEEIEVPVGDGEKLRIVHMKKTAHSTNPD